MDRAASVGDLIAVLRQEIADRQHMIDQLEARVGPAPKSDGARKPSAAATAVEILREAGRPMHGLHEVFPALQARGYTLAYRAGFATMLLRTGKVVRTAPGTFAYREGRAANDATE